MCLPLSACGAQGRSLGAISHRYRRNLVSMQVSRAIPGARFAGSAAAIADKKLQALSFTFLRRRRVETARCTRIGGESGVNVNFIVEYPRMPFLFAGCW